jgi:hypothetical protein
MQETIYQLNGVQAGFLDLGLQKQDVTVPPIIQMPASWNTPRTRYNVRIIGTFQLPKPGDLFVRKFWIGKTPIAQVNAQAIRQSEARFFEDRHTIIFYGDNLHGVYSTHCTGLASCGSFVEGEGNTATTEKFGGALPATMECSGIDAPVIIDDDWNRLSLSLFATAQDQDAKIFYSVRDVFVEKIT